LDRFFITHSLIFRQKDAQVSEFASHDAVRILGLSYIMHVDETNQSMGEGETYKRKTTLLISFHKPGPIVQKIVGYAVKDLPLIRL
jgi:hypothetical protein